MAKKNVTPDKYIMDGEHLFIYDSENGILELSAPPEMIESLENDLDNDHEFQIELPTGVMITFGMLKEIKSLPTSKGTYILERDCGE